LSKEAVSGDGLLVPIPGGGLWMGCRDHVDRPAHRRANPRVDMIEPATTISVRIAAARSARKPSGWALTLQRAAASS
jgi:hypothetical protein